MLSITDPSFRYAEHKKMKAYYDAEVFIKLTNYCFTGDEFENALDQMFGAFPNLKGENTYAC